MPFIQLRSGPLLREEAIVLALDLEARGHAMSARDGKLNVSSGSHLTAADREAIARVRLHLMALVGYIEEGHEAR